MIDIKKAKYILFPYFNREYALYGVKNITKLPITTYNNRYDKWLCNEHHYTTEYHNNVVLPTLNRILNFGFNINDFLLNNFNSNEGYDLSYLIPKTLVMYKIHSYTYNIDISGEYNELIENFNCKTLDNTSLYHQLYIFPHLCSKIENLTINNKKLLISGDSLMIPSIMPLSYYYKEIYYFDNRLYGKLSNYDNALSLSKNIDNVKFNDILILLYANPLEKYIKINLK